jgi:hypothetical protein
VAARGRAHVEALALAAAVRHPPHGDHADGVAVEACQDELAVRPSVELAEARVLVPRRRLELGEAVAEQLLDEGALLAEHERGLRELEGRADAVEVDREAGSRVGCRGHRYAAAASATASNPSSRIAISRIRNFWTLPVTVIGKPSTSLK